MLKPGGYVYLDDTDKHHADLKQAETLLRNTVSSRGGEVVEYSDFSPEQLFVKQGILARIH